MTASRFWPFPLMAWLLLGMVSPLAAGLSPWDAWRLGYTNFELGEQVRGRGDYTAALEAFEKARGHYMAVKKARPDWNQKVIRERIAACDKQIFELRRLLGKNTTETPDAGSAVQRPEAVKSAAVNPLETQLTLARTRLAEATAELNDLRREQVKRRSYETEIAELIRDQRMAREKYALLEKSYQKLRDELKKPDSSLRELNNQLVEKHAQLENSVKTIRLLEERLRRGEQNALDLTRDKNLMRNQLRQESEERLRLEREAVSLREAASAERERTRKAEERVAALEKSLRDLENRQQVQSTVGESGTAVAEELVKLRSIASAAGSRANQFQKQCVELRLENSSLLKKLQNSEASRNRFEQEGIAARAESVRQRTRAESLTAELAEVRELQQRQEQELKRVLSDSEKLRARLARRGSEDFQGLIEARSEQRRQEEVITALKTRESELSLMLDEEKKTAKKLFEAQEKVKRDLLRSRGEKLKLEEELTALRPDAEKFHELYPRYQELVRNFEALRKENQENRIKLAAASPQEAELKRIKLRLVELDQLKTSLGREQRLTAELTAAKKRLESELAELREQGAALAESKKQLESLKALQNEVQELRKINREAVSRLQTMQKLEDELVLTKKALIESGAAQLELHDVKAAYAQVLGERNAAATEAARLRDTLSPGSVSGGAESGGMAQTLERTRQELRSTRDRMDKLEALLPQIQQLKKLNDELLHARSFESELLQARAALSELNRYKDELAGVIKLNEQLVREKSELEKELALRPRLPQSEQSAAQIKLIRAARREKPEDYVSEGMLAESDDSEELAIWNYRKALELAPDHAEASERLGRMLLRRGEYDEAARLLSTARVAAPERVDLALAVSRAYLGQKRYGNAQAVLDPLLKLHPENGELLTVAALALAEGGDSARAESYLRLAIRYLPKSPEPRIEFARLLVRGDSARLDEAARLYEEARMLNAPPDPELEPQLGPRLDQRREMEEFLVSAMNEAFENKDFSGAAWYCRQLLELDRNPGRFSPLLALARYLGGENGAARETLTFNRQSAYGALVLALVELKDGNRRAFAMALRRAGELTGDRPQTIDAARRNLGYALDAAGTADAAAAAELKRAYQWDTPR